MHNKKKKFLFVSPHFDDAVLSCGGLIHKLSASETLTYVLTIFSGLPDPTTLSDAAKEFHNDIQLGDNAIEIRRAEDLNASDFLGYHPIHFDFLESQYRQNPNGGHIYKKLDDIFTGKLEDEQKCIEQLILKMKDFLSLHSFDAIYIPTGVGNHIDHLIARFVIEEISKKEESLSEKVIYYEDMPYACYLGQVFSENYFRKKIQTYLEPLSEFNFKAKMEAIALYESQINMLWDGHKKMINSYKNYSRYLSNDKGEIYERYWKSC